MISHPSRHCTVELQALPSRIGQVRRIVSAQLRYWHMDLLIDRAALGVTELLTNVHLHARPDKTCTVEMELLLDRLTVSVHDRDPRLPVVDDAAPLATCGRGLAMVAAMSESWGVRPDGESGKSVWFSLPTAAVAPPPAAPPVAARPPRRLVEEVPVVEEVPAGASAGALAEVGHGAGLRSPQPAPARSAVAG
ncbi:ATP-binding protein [Streptomyces sp. enrichment culture]|uniref:ATP-binding protein n=1 Tax=Streptomyces sp. enrichment culture TaxID=1795815 RepID=UPI003F54E3E1